MKLNQKLDYFPLTDKMKEYTFATAHISNPIQFSLQNRPTCLKLLHKQKMSNYVHNFLIQNIKECRAVRSIQGPKCTPTIRLYRQWKHGDSTVHQSSLMRAFKVDSFWYIVPPQLTAGIEFLRDETGGKKGQSETIKAYNCPSKTKNARAIAQALEIHVLKLIEWPSLHKFLRTVWVLAQSRDQSQ